ncbi:MAG: peptide deformylase [Candidatus Omnitrophica bacterium]|nr:peptide deformylase [Candidatus Omnitrophota bacterium]
MSVLSIRRLPDPILNQPTHLVGRFDAPTQRFIDQMIATMRHHPRCVGLAAPQVGSRLRIAVMDASAHPKAGRTHGLLVLVNPVLGEPEAAEIRREGCLSIPAFTGDVRRATRVHLRAQDREGQAYERRLEGFEAVVAQHEVDHLNGKLFLDRVANLATDVFRRKTYL